MGCVVAPRSTDLSGTTLGCLAIKLKVNILARFGVERKFSLQSGLQGPLLLLLLHSFLSI